MKSSLKGFDNFSCKKTSKNKMQYVPIYVGLDFYKNKIIALKLGYT